MKLHLPITLLTAVLAAVIALPAQAVEAPEGYTTTYLNSPGILETYSELTEEEYIAFILHRSQEITPAGADYWTSSTPLVSGGNVFFGSGNSDSPVALSFKNGFGPAFSGQSALTFDTLSNLTFSTIAGSSSTSDYDSYGGAICAENGAVTISNNGDVTFSENSAASSQESRGGAIYADGGHTISLSGNRSLTFQDNTSSGFGGAIYSDDGKIIISDNDCVSFRRNSTGESGGAVGGYYGACTEISNNTYVEFCENSASYGAALYQRGYSTPEYIKVIENGDVIFSKNTTSKYGGAIFCGVGVQIILSGNRSLTFQDNTSSDFGGAIYSDNGKIIISDNDCVSFRRNSSGVSGGAVGGYYGTCTEISNNTYVEFCENSASYGAALYQRGYSTPEYIKVIENGDVIFSKNTTSMYGGAIFCGVGVQIILNDNKGLYFNDNTSAYGGAVYGDKDDIVNLIGNGEVSFVGNKASSLGGAIGGYVNSTINLANNESVIFRMNSAPSGGAIHTKGNLYIQNNGSVLFEKNYENNNGIYRLRSIYSDGGMTLSAKTGGNITFYDSVYTSGNAYFNSDYTDADGNTQSAKGDVIFSGKYAEQHLNEILAANNENRTATAEEILNSQTSEIGGNVYVNGGSLQIVDGAVVKVNGDTVSIEEGSNATLAVSDAELVATNATIEVGASATLQLSNGASVTADEINIAAGATLSLGDIATTAEASDAMVAAYRLSSLNVINADLTFAAGSTLVTDDAGASMTEGSILTFNATSDGEKINLVFTLGTEYSEDGLVQLFSNVDIVKFLMDGEEVDSSTTLLASDFFTGTGINENTTLHYNSTANVVYLQGVNNAVPEPTTATLSLLALAALAARRRRK